MTTKADQVAKLSGTLAASLGLNPAEGGSPIRKPTAKGRLMLTALAASPKGKASPDQLLEAFPETFAGWTQAAFHETAKTLARHGWIERKRRMTHNKTTGRVQGGQRAYVTTPTGREVLAKYDSGRQVL